MAVQKRAAAASGRHAAELRFRDELEAALEEQQLQLAGVHDSDLRSLRREMTEKMVAAAPLFAADGAQSLRFGHFITGDTIGQHLLGVSYKSMAAIERTYDALAQNDNFCQMSTENDINMRSIIQLYG